MTKMAENSVLWDDFKQRYSLSEQQVAQFQRYAELLQHSLSNVTALTTVQDIIAYHFSDSLELTTIIPLHTSTGYADVGSGAGLPGIALNIFAPQCTAVLIEVIGKKRDFMASVVAELGLQNVIIDSRDWRTFLRTTHFPLDLICSRAALAPNELLRMFQPASPYRDATLVYWASTTWESTVHEASFITQEHHYTVGAKQRKLIVMRKK